MPGVGVSAGTAPALVPVRVMMSGPGERWDSTGWDDYVRGHPAASLYHEAVFRGLLTDVLGHRTYYLTALTDQGTVAGVLPLARLRSPMFGDFLVSLPCFNYGGALADGGAVTDRLMAAAVDLGGQLGVDHAEFRDLALLDGDWPVRTDKVVMHLALPDDPDTLWKTFGSKLRAQVRRPLKGGASVHSGGVEQLDDFYAVFARNMRDLGTPVYPRRWFRRLCEGLGERAHILVVRVDGVPAAAGLLLRHRGVMEIPWASSDRRYNHLGVNMLLYWEALRLSVEQGARTFDFGRSTVDSGTYRFKRQWGAEPVPLYWHYWLPEGGTLPGLNPDNPRFRRAIRLWQRLPLPMANWLGPRVVRYLP
ncbi:FemAB family XrtA/PEP-CTERM system-associated protein [Arhodomonas aquaeolei]|uniref:FemAB family XrtA/PEP-CTERM system-associated protein n=1 Tax=Arhodomonas aquaeolei TaxID=2369 RepID=UPI00036AAE54|nr:FemAB family XrtA/PEP-CTERM system-associated protein [Arhodomonas aquaeolei]